MKPNPPPGHEVASTFDQERLVAALAQPSLFGPACDHVTLLQTHISYVLLTGRHAYKLKKAVNLGFLDFSTLAARRYFCERELRLNRRLAPALYLDVVAITGTIDAPAIGGNGPALEYAVKMLEFPQEALASRVLARGELGSGDIDALASKVAAFHGASDRAAPDSMFGSPATILRLALANFTHLRPSLVAVAELQGISALETWTQNEHAARSATFHQRRQDGFIRECHGDLHLGNIAVIDGELVVFDCIEFNDEMRWIDVMSEIAFTAMDLEERGHTGLAHRFLNSYLESTGDYGGLAVLRFYLVYRALVRAKIAQLRAAQLPSAQDPAPLARERDGYLRFAEMRARPPGAAIIITHGVSGCGKTALSGMLLEQIGAIRIRTDVERKRHFGWPPTHHAASTGESALYSSDANRQTYAEVRRLAAGVATAGFVTIVDGAFLQRWQRDLFRGLAAELGIPFVVLALTAGEATLRRRIALRNRRGTDASDADVAVLEQQLRTREVLAKDEAAFAVVIDTGVPLESMRSPKTWRPVIERIGRAGSAPSAGEVSPRG